MSDNKNDKPKIPKNKEWLDLCSWIELELFGYNPSKQKLGKQSCLVLCGLTKGQEVANNKNQTRSEERRVGKEC